MAKNFPMRLIFSVKHMSLRCESHAARVYYSCIYIFIIAVISSVQSRTFCILDQGVVKKSKKTPFFSQFFLPYKWINLFVSQPIFFKKGLKFVHCLGACSYGCLIMDHWDRQRFKESTILYIFVHRIH